MSLPPIMPVRFPETRPWGISETASQGPWAFPEHRHGGYCDLTLVCEGTLTSTINRQSAEYGAGTLLWVREADWHALCGSGFRFFNLNVCEERLHTLAMAMGEEERFLQLRTGPGAPAVQLGDGFAQLEREIAQLHSRQNEPVASLLLQPILARTLAALMAPLIHDGRLAPKGEPDWLRKGMAQLEANLDRGATLAELIAACGRSSEHVSRSFRRHVGMSPSAWLNRQRLARAAMLLASTNRDIMAICYALGFNSASYFYRLFRQAYGMPPLQYRKKTNPFRF